MKSKKEIIEGLRHCTMENCTVEACPYDIGSSDCISNLMKDALELIEAEEEE